MRRAPVLLAVVLTLGSLEAIAAERKLSIKTFDGRVISGVVVLETERTLLLRTEQGNVNVAWAEIESSTEDSGAPRGVTAAPSKSAAKIRLGLSAGVGVGPSGSPFSSEAIWWAAELAPFVDLDFGLLGVRFALELQPGLRGIQSYARPFSQLFGGVDSQLRLHFTERFGIGIGVGLELGVLGAYQSYGGFGNFGAAFALGPTLTAASVRLGANFNHEVSLSGSVLFASGPTAFAFAGGLGLVRYAYLF